jgi:5,6-dimethylbenzimidazole synthase
MSLSFETASFRAAFLELLSWRRDVRCFRPDPLPEALVAELLQAAVLAPSVGLSQSWRFVRVRSPIARQQVRRSFERCNAEALSHYSGEDAALYARLKLQGLDQAPEHIAVFSEQATQVGRGLGRRTMPESLDFSVVASIQTLWLMARAHGVGVGWVSILDPAEAVAALDVPASWKLIAYLCLGYPQTPAQTPELERQGWDRRIELADVVLER